MAIFSQRTTPFDSSHVAVVRICRSPFGNLHTGIAYASGGKLKDLHLGWEDALQTDWDRVGFWVIPTVDPLLLGRISGKCRRILRAFQKSKKFPYGLGYRNVTFSKHGVPQVHGHGVGGLSCTTFVVAVFESVGARLVNEPSWPVRVADDVAHIKSLEPACEKYPGLFQRLLSEAEGGAVRIRPTELVGACTCAPEADFSQACIAVKDLAIPEPITIEQRIPLSHAARSVTVRLEGTKDPNSNTPDALFLTHDQRLTAISVVEKAWRQAHGDQCPEEILSRFRPAP